MRRKHISKKTNWLISSSVDQLVSYAFFAEYALGDNLGQPSRRWLSDWKFLPEGVYLPSEILSQLNRANINSPEPLLRVPHLGNDAQVDFKWHLPYIGFDARGRLLGVKPATPDSMGWVIRIGRRRRIAARKTS